MFVAVTFCHLEAWRLRAADFACFERAFFDAAEWPSRFRAFVVALDRFADGVCFRDDWPALLSWAAFLRVASDVVPFFGDASFTPARRAFESPMAMACFVDRAPCLPLRTWSIYS